MTGDDAIETLKALIRIGMIDTDKLKANANFMQSDSAKNLLDLIRSGGANMDINAQKKAADNAFELKRYNMNKKSKATDTLGLLRDTMVGGPYELAMKAAWATAGEAPEAIGNMVGNMYDSNAERRMVGSQTEGQRRAWGISPADVAKQRYASRQGMISKNVRQFGKSVSNVLKAVGGARNAADTAARMQAVAGGDRLSTGGYWALNRMLGMIS